LISISEISRAYCRGQHRHLRNQLRQCRNIRLRGAAKSIEQRAASTG